MFFRAFVNLRVGTIVRLMDFFRLLFGFSGRSFVDEFFFFLILILFFFFFELFYFFVVYNVEKRRSVMEMIIKNNCKFII